MFRGFEFAALCFAILKPSRFCVSRFYVRDFVFRGFVCEVINVNRSYKAVLLNLQSLTLLPLSILSIKILVIIIG